MNLENVIIKKISMTHYFINKIFLILLTFFISFNAYCQDNQTEANIRYASAEEYYSNGDAINALNNLNKAEGLLGNTNSNILYLKIKSTILLQYDSRTICNLNNLFDKYFAITTKQNTSEEKYNEIVKARQYFDDYYNLPKYGWYKKLYQIPLLCDRFGKNPSGILDSLSEFSSFLPLLSENIPNQNLQTIEGSDESSNIFFTKYMFSFPIKLLARNENKLNNISLIKFKTPNYSGYLYWFLLSKFMQDNCDFWYLLKDTSTFEKNSVNFFSNFENVNSYASINKTKKPNELLLNSGSINIHDHGGVCQKSSIKLLPNTSYIIYISSKNNIKWDDVYISLCYSKTDNKDVFKYFFKRNGELKNDR